jgi:hypothetical protein
MLPLKRQGVNVSYHCGTVLGTLLAVTGSVHPGPRLLVN